MREVIPELFVEDDEECNKFLFGCPDCDLLLQVSDDRTINLMCRSSEPSQCST